MVRDYEKCMLSFFEDIVISYLIDFDPKNQETDF